MIVNGAAVLRSRTTSFAGQFGSLIDRIVKYMANSDAKNISSEESHTMTPTLTRLGRVSEPCDGIFSSAVAEATAAFLQSWQPLACRPPTARRSRPERSAACELAHHSEA